MKGSRIIKILHFIHLLYLSLLPAVAVFFQSYELFSDGGNGALLFFGGFLLASLYFGITMELKNFPDKIGGAIWTVFSVPIMAVFVIVFGNGTIGEYFLTLYITELVAILASLFFSAMLLNKSWKEFSKDVKSNYGFPYIFFTLAFCLGLYWFVQIMDLGGNLFFVFGLFVLILFESFNYVRLIKRKNLIDLDWSFPLILVGVIFWVVAVVLGGVFAN